VYLAHYNLANKPFNISPDPDFLWLGEKHAEALAGLEYGILENKGFLLLTGEIGTGKTVLINALIKLINQKVVVANIQDPKLELTDFYNRLAYKFKMDRRYEKKGDFLIHFEEFLIKTYRHSKDVLLIIDEAQRLTNDLLEEIRVLSNIELDNRKLINIFFIGQSELKKMLLEEMNRPLEQRITYNYHLDPLNEQETASFIEHRLNVAGASRKFFTDKAICEIHNFSQGIPRLINIICDHSLMTGYSAGLTMIDLSVIRECAKELQITYDPPRPHAKRTTVIEYDSPSRQQQIINYVRKLEPLNKAPNLKITGISIIIIIIFGIAASFFYTSRIEQPPNLLKKDNEILMSEDSIENSKKRTVEILNYDGDTEDTLTDKLSGDKVQSDKNFEEINIPEEQPDNEMEEFKTDTISKNEVAQVHLPRKKNSDLINSIINEVKKTIVKEVDQSAKPPDDQQSLIFSEHKFLVHFKPNSTDLDSQALEKLKKIDELLSQSFVSEIIIEGYADSYGNDNYNQTLSQLRSKIVESYLISQGVTKSSIKSIGLGSENPIGDNKTLEGRSKNRRVEVRVKIGTMAI
jgi:general secretion pathway protein A